MILVTGGTGFIGSALVKRLVAAGEHVRVFDDNSRGHLNRLDHNCEFVFGDIRSSYDVNKAMCGVDEVIHLAFVNGTQNFYKYPARVLDVGVKGITNLLDAMLVYEVGKLLLASSSEVYQTPPSIPTDETVPLSIPDPFNPRYSYAAGKIISEIMAIHYAKFFNRVLIIRPHNIYGPDMGYDHVIPQMVQRIKQKGVLEFQTSAPTTWGNERPFWGGGETRAFCYIDDAIDGIMTVREKGQHLNIYNIGTDEEVSIMDLALKIAELTNRKVEVTGDKGDDGGVLRRCPDISKLRALGYEPKVPLAVGLPSTLKWYLSEELNVVSGL